MVTDYATSPDGVEWTWHGTALSGRPGRWDARGVRVSAVVTKEGSVTAYYDGRASAEENYEERTGVATGDSFSAFVPEGARPAASSPYGGGGLRYLCAVPLPDGGWRLYYEVTRADGAHEPRAEMFHCAADAWAGGYSIVHGPHRHRLSALS